MSKQEIWAVAKISAALVIAISATIWFAWVTTPRLDPEPYDPDNYLTADDINQVYEVCGCEDRVSPGEMMRQVQFDRLYECCHKAMEQTDAVVDQALHDSSEHDVDAALALIESLDTLPHAEDVNRIFRLCGCQDAVHEGDRMMAVQFERLYECCEVALEADRANLTPFRPK